MLLSPLFLHASQTQLDRTLDRFARFMRSAQTLSVDIRAHIPKFPGEGRAHLTLAKPNLERFSAQWGVAKYGFAQGATRFVEYIPNDRSYVQGPAFPIWITPPGELSDMAGSLFPAQLLAGDFRKVAENVKLLGGVAGASGSVVTGRIRAASAFLECRLRIDDRGRPVRLSFYTEGDAKLLNELSFTNWVVDRKYPAQFFDDALPAGYRADSLPFESNPIGVEEAFPIGGWTRLGAGPDFVQTIQGGGRSKLTLVIAGDAHCEPTVRCLKWAEQNLALFQKQRIETVVVQEGPTALSKALPSFSGATGSLWRRLRLSGTPSLFLVDGAGRVRWLYIGFPLNAGRQIRSDLMKVIQGD